MEKKFYIYEVSGSGVWCQGFATVASTRPNKALKLTRKKLNKTLLGAEIKYDQVKKIEGGFYLGESEEILAHNEFYI